MRGIYFEAATGYESVNAHINWLRVQEGMTIED